MDAIISSALEEICSKGRDGVALSSLCSKLGLSVEIRRALWANLLEIPVVQFRKRDRVYDHNDPLVFMIFLLEMEKKRANGITQNQLSKEFEIEGNRFFYVVRKLEKRGLIVRQEAVEKTRGSSKQKRKQKTSLIHLYRYAKHLGSQEKFEVTKDEGSIGKEDSEDVLIDDYLPSIKTICDKLEETHGKVLTLINAGLVEETTVKVNGKVSLITSAFYDLEYSSCLVYRLCVEGKEFKFGRCQIANQLVELPIDHQIYDTIDATGSKGMLITEVGKRFGINKKTNHRNRFSVSSRFGMPMQVELHNKSHEYRIRTSRNSESSNLIPSKKSSLGGNPSILDGSARISHLWNFESDTLWKTNNHENEIKLSSSSPRDSEASYSISNTCKPQELIHETRSTFSSTAIHSMKKLKLCQFSTVDSTRREQRILERLQVEKNFYLLGMIYGRQDHDLHNLCVTFDVEGAIKGIPLELFFQVVGSSVIVEKGVSLRDLSNEEYNELYDTSAIRRLSLPVSISQRLKIHEMNIFDNSSTQRCATSRYMENPVYSLELKPYIEEPTLLIACSNFRSLDLRSDRHVMDEMTRHDSWASVRRMTVGQKAAVLKLLAKVKFNEKLPYRKCKEISKNLNLTMEQKNLPRSAGSDEDFIGEENSTLASPREHESQLQEQQEEDHSKDSERPGANIDKYHSPNNDFGIFQVEICLSLRQLVIQYVKQTVGLGAKLYDEDRVSFGNLPTHLGACRRRMRFLKQNKRFRESLNSLCNMLSKQPEGTAMEKIKFALEVLQSRQEPIEEAPKTAPKTANVCGSQFLPHTESSAARFSRWLDEHGKDFMRGGLDLTVDLHCGGTFHLFALVSSGELFISPSVPVEGVGEAEFIKGLSTPFVDDSFDNRREKGFPGIKLSVHRAPMPRAVSLGSSFKIGEHFGNVNHLGNYSGILEVESDSSHSETIKENLNFEHTVPTLKDSCKSPSELMVDHAAHLKMLKKIISIVLRIVMQNPGIQEAHNLLSYIMYDDVIHKMDLPMSNSQFLKQKQQCKKLLKLMVRKKCLIVKKKLQTKSTGVPAFLGTLIGGNLTKSELTFGEHFFANPKTIFLL
ncbi:B-block binding subunit of TFIIIC [Gossypium australe]|uniref:B-block binding subunit of TFIIIC n=1 Tax=Gossypium australe TaxID=47621 RepID=A0A5B6WBA4_9ROSI|nr:B-block binding subunit of TFIIIC [Gossypium australe]